MKKTTVSGVLVARFNDLKHMIEPDSQLFGELRAKSVLTPDEIDTVRRTGNSVNGEVGKILDYIIGKSAKSEDAGQSFLECLREACQGHVANYIRHHVGAPDAVYSEDEWPLYDSNVSALETNWTTLVDLLDTRSGLLDDLFSHGAISREQLQLVESEKTDKTCNERLLVFLQRRSLGDFRQLVKSLIYTNQISVAGLLAPDEVGPAAALCSI